MGDGSWFVHRSPFEGPSATLVGRLPDRTPLAWFRRVWAATADAGRIDDQLHSYRLVEEHLAAELGTDVFDLTMLFTAGRGSNPVCRRTSAARRAGGTQACPGSRPPGTWSRGPST